MHKKNLSKNCLFDQSQQINLLSQKKFLIDGFSSFPTYIFQLFVYILKTNFYDFLLKVFYFYPKTTTHKKRKK